MKQSLTLNINIFKYFFFSSLASLLICSGLLVLEKTIVTYIMILILTVVKNIVFDVILFLVVYFLCKKIDIIDKEISDSKQLMYKLGAICFTAVIITLDYVLNDPLSAFEFSYGIFIPSCILYFFIKPKPLSLNTIS